MATAKPPKPATAETTPAKRTRAPKANTTTAKDVEAFGAHVVKGLSYPNKRKYATAEALFDKAKEFFEQLDGPPTLAGAALYLNFSSTQRFNTYCNQRAQKDPEYMEVYAWVKTQLEHYHERRIASGLSNSTGSIFWLKAVAGYQDVQTINQTIDQKVTVSEEMNFAERANRAQALLERVRGRVEPKNLTIEGVAVRVDDPAKPAEQLTDDLCLDDVPAQPAQQQPVAVPDDDWMV